MERLDSGDLETQLSAAFQDRVIVSRDAAIGSVSTPARASRSTRPHAVEKIAATTAGVGSSCAAGTGGRGVEDPRPLPGDRGRR